MQKSKNLLIKRNLKVKIVHRLPQKRPRRARHQRTIKRSCEDTKSICHTCRIFPEHNKTPKNKSPRLSPLIAQATIVKEKIAHSTKRCVIAVHCIAYVTALLELHPAGVYTRVRTHARYEQMTLMGAVKCDRHLNTRPSVHDYKHHCSG